MIHDDPPTTDAHVVANGMLRAEVARLQELSDYWRIQAQDVLTQLHETEAEVARLTDLLARAEETIARRDEHDDEPPF